MDRSLGSVTPNQVGSNTRGRALLSPSETQRGAAIVEHVLLIGLLMVTLIGVLILYSLAIKQVACERIFIGNGEFRFSPGTGHLDWMNDGPDGAGCYVTAGWLPDRIF
jgi:hypothetical protein